MHFAQFFDSDPPVAFRDGRTLSRKVSRHDGARLNVSLPGMDRVVAQALVDDAHKTCPYSKATRGNIDVTINVV